MMKWRLKELLLGLVITCGLLGLFVFWPDKGGEAPPKLPVEIEFWYGLSGRLGDQMEEAIDDFNRSQGGVRVVGVAQSSYEETAQAFRAAMVRKKPPAVLLLEDQRMQFFANVGALSPLDSLIGGDADFQAEDFIPSFYQQGQFNGFTYALPLYGTTQILYYRKDLFAQAGIDPDRLDTWEGLAEAAAALTRRNGPDVLVNGWEPMQGADNLIDAAISRGGRLLSDDGRQVTIAAAEWVEAWEFFRRAIHDERIMRVHYGGDGWDYWYATIHDVLQGRAAGYTGSSGDQGDLDFQIIGARIQPAWRDRPGFPRAVAHAHAICIPAAVPEDQQRAAFLWMRYMTSPEMTARWSMQTGYLPVRRSAMDIPAYQQFTRENPQILVPYSQTKLATRMLFDPTGGKIYEALRTAADRVEIEAVPAAIALEEARVQAQEELDKFYAGGDSH